MKTIALRFGDNIAPKEGTIAIHQSILQKNGYVWYGKFGSPISTKIASVLLKNDNARILLIQSGKSKRYWAFVESVQWEKPKDGLYPAYYEQVMDRFKTWFKLVRIEDAPNDIMSKCYVTSSGTSLANASKSSMSPYFIIDINIEVL